ncbi:SIP domain-containing protein [Pseudogemmobacter sonorensis]|uniref:SIP domain-containing protein n=1 Tax=Pseudogemmobacter sonorensis TaxID=2989681 RepID=UPI003694D90D
MAVGFLKALLRATFFGYRKFQRPEPEPRGYLLMGDAAAIPAINSILADLPPDAEVRAILQANDPEGAAIPMFAHPRLHAIWTGPGAAALAEAVPEGDWSDWYAWTADENTAAKAAWAALNPRNGFSLTGITHAACWIRGKEMRLKKERDEAPAHAAGASVAPPEPVAAVADVATAEALAADAVAQPVLRRGRWRSQGSEGL